MYRTTLIAAGAALLLAAGCGSEESTTTQGAAPQVEKPGAKAGGGCDRVPGHKQLKRLVKQAPDKIKAGGLAGGRYEWAATVNRAGELCAIAVSTDNSTDAWPGSRAIAAAKAFTANGFSSDKKPLSTARLYTMAQPGRSLYGAAAANPFDPRCLASARAGTLGEEAPRVCGGTIVFGGGVPLYDGKTRVGGLGASGDTPCADHEIAKQMRDMAGLNPPKGKHADDIQYRRVDGPSLFVHPVCKNTWRNGKEIGDPELTRMKQAPNDPSSPTAGSPSGGEGNKEGAPEGGADG